MFSVRIIKLLLIACAIATSAAADDVDGFRSIFDGQSLDGWHVKRASKGDKYVSSVDNFVAKDGVLHCVQLKDRKGALLLSDQKYGDFILKMDIRADWGCDSGIFLRCDENGRGIQILNDYLENGNVGFVFGQGTGGYISRPILLNEIDGQIQARDVYDAVEREGLVYAINAETWNQTWKAGEWNSIEIRCVGNAPYITTSINGVKVMEMDGETYHAPSLRNKSAGEWDAASAWNSQKVQEMTGNIGSIGLQVHPGGRWKRGGASMYRNIQIKVLNEETNAEVERQKDG